MVYFGSPREAVFPRRVGSGYPLPRRIDLGDGISVSFVDADLLRPHEMISIDRLEKLRESIAEDGVLFRPILVERSTGTVLDGHHRLAALRSMGARLIPAVLIPYESERLELYPRRSEIPVSRGEVLRRSARGELFPPKTTRHVLDFDPPDVRVRISDLVGVGGGESD